MNIEIERLTLLVNVYKDKLTRRETENRNLLVELQQYKKWKENYQNLSQKYNSTLEELEKLKKEIKELIEKHQKQVEEHLETIRKLKLQISDL